MSVMKSKRMQVAAALAALAVPTVAAAATFSGDGTFVGTSANDTFNLGNGNDAAYGLAGKDTLNAGNGNDVLDGDGSCQNGSNNQYYCTDGPISGDGGDTINAVNSPGSDVIYGGGGKNTINAGYGADTIYGGPVQDTINVNTNKHATIAKDTITLGKTSANNAVNVWGNIGGTIYAQQGKADTMNCSGAPILVYADKVDQVNSCPNVKYTSPSLDVRRRASKASRRQRIVVKRKARSTKHARSPKRASQ
jgi:Ca2+-binding RTX toxin-like protein